MDHGRLQGTEAEVHARRLEAEPLPLPVKPPPHEGQPRAGQGLAPLGEEVLVRHLQKAPLPGAEVGEGEVGGVEGPEEASGEAQDAVGGRGVGLEEGEVEGVGLRPPRGVPPLQLGGLGVPVLGLGKAARVHGEKGGGAGREEEGEPGGPEGAHFPP